MDTNQESMENALLLVACRAEPLASLLFRRSASTTMLSGSHQLQERSMLFLQVTLVLNQLCMFLDSGSLTSPTTLCKLFHFIYGRQWASSAASKHDSTAHSTPRETHRCRRQGTQPAWPPGTARPVPLFFHLLVNLFPILFYLPCDSASNYFCHGRKD